MKKPLISVLIATADRPDLLAGCLESLGVNRFADAEVLILDQSLEDPPGVRWNAGALQVRYVRCPRRGKSAALNLGVRAARGSILAFTDDDCRVSEDWLDVILRETRLEGGKCALTGRVLGGSREGDAVTAPSLRDEREPKVYRTPAFRDVLFGNNMAIPVDLVRRTGCFDEALGPGTDLPAAEDNDLGYRLLRAGVPIRYLPEMVVVHRSWRPPGEQVQVYRGYGLGQGAFYGKHARRGDLHMVARMVRNLWDASRDLGGAVLLGRTYDVRTSSAFAGGLVRGFLRTALASNGRGRKTTLRVEEP